MDGIRIDGRACVRCAACSILAPAVFAVSRKGARVLRPPELAGERTASRAAALACPARAIHLEAP